MINFYAYTYPNEVTLIPANQGLWVKLGDTIRTPQTRMDEQGGASEREAKIIVGTWLNVTTIARDYQLHKVLRERGCQNKKQASGKGTEWFKLPKTVTTLEEARVYISQLIDEVGGKNTSRKTITLRGLQKSTIAQSMKIIKDTHRVGQYDEVNIVANLCPRFGKTIWALTLFNEISEKYGARIMLLPAYWLSVHSSFEDEIQQFREFANIDYISAKDDDAEDRLVTAFKEGRNVVLDISLHGDLEGWKSKYEWLSKIKNSEFFVFADEADFGSHTDNQLEKTKFLFEDNDVNDDGVFVSIFASGTNIQRIAKNATGKLIDGVLDVAYSQLEQTEPDIIKRMQYSLSFDGLHEILEEEFKPELIPSWNRIWTKPLKCQEFITDLFRGITNSKDDLAGISLSSAADEDISGIMCFLSCNKRQMAQTAKIVEKAIPDWKIIVLNGDETSNRKAQAETKNEIKWAKQPVKSKENPEAKPKKGIIILSNMMGSRSYSIPEIQASVIMYDNGSVDATSQKISRCLTPGNKWDGTPKEFGHIFSFSFDPNRNENIEQLIISEAVQVQSAQNIEFADAVKFVFKSVNIFRVDDDGDCHIVSTTKMFESLNKNENLLRIADISVRIDNLTDDAYDILEKVVGLDSKGKQKMDKLLPKAKVKDKREKPDAPAKPLTTEEQRAKKELEKILNIAVRAINRSATTVYNIAMKGETYKECLTAISKRVKLQKEFTEFYGITTTDAISLIDGGVLNSPILDIVVQNSKTQVEWVL